MAHALLPDFSRLTLRTGARDSVRDEIMADLIERAIALVQSRNLGDLRGAAEAAQQYKDAMDALRNRDFSLLMTAAWQASAKRYAAFLQRALEALEDLSTYLQSDILDEDIEAVEVQPYLDKRAVLEAILTGDENKAWETYGARVPLGREGYDAHKARLRRAMEDMQSAIDVLNRRPQPNTATEEERRLWRTDLLEVMRQAALTRTTGEVDAARAPADRQQTGGGASSARADRYRAHYNMPIPELTPHMQLIFNLIMGEVNEIKEMILRNGMGPGQDVRETVDFGAFGLGRATIQVTAARSAYFIRWFLSNDAQPRHIQRLIGSETENAKRFASSVPGLKRWLYWLDQNVLSDRDRRNAARTWIRNPPVRSQRVVGAANA